MRLPYLTEQPLPAGLEPALEALEAALGEGTHGYLRAWTPAGQRFLFFLRGRVHSAGRLDGDEFAAAGVGETVRALRTMQRAVFCGTDMALLLCLAVPFRKAPAAQVPAHLVDPHMLLDSVRRTGADAVLVVRRGDARTLAFCRNGEPEALYEAHGEPFPSDGSIADRIVEYVFADGSPSATLDIYDEIRLPPAPDAGEPLASYLAGTAAEALPTKTLVVRLGERVVFQYPMTQREILVGRGPEADLTLDNLSVSRRHATIRRDGDVLVVDDLGGKNGLELRGRKVERAVLAPGEAVGVGKYTLEYRDAAPDQSAPRRRASVDRMAGIQETMLVEPSSGLVLRREGRDGEDYKLRMVLTIGRTEAANVVVKGWWIAPVHVQIVRGEDGTFQAMHIAGRRSLRVNGVKVRQAPLKVGDRIQLGRNVFTVLRAED